MIFRYFRRDAEEASSGGPSIAEMVRREREGGTRGMDESYARNVLKKGKRFKACCYIFQSIFSLVLCSV